MTATLVMTEIVVGNGDHIGGYWLNGGRDHGEGHSGDNGSD